MIVLSLLPLPSLLERLESIFYHRKPQQSLGSHDSHSLFKGEHYRFHFSFLYAQLPKHQFSPIHDSRYNFWCVGETRAWKNSNHRKKWNKNDLKIKHNQLKKMEKTYRRIRYQSPIAIAPDSVSAGILLFLWWKIRFRSDESCKRIDRHPRMSGNQTSAWIHGLITIHK